MKNFLKLVALSATLMISSCGFVSDAPVANLEVIKMGELQTCKIDITQLSQIFKTNQKNQILCLQENLLQYTRYVRSENSAFISLPELSAFIRKFYPDQSETMIKAVNIIFQLNSLLFRDEASRISRTNIVPFFDFLAKLNEEAVAINQILSELNSRGGRRNFWQLREAFNSSIMRFSEHTIGLVDNSRGSVQRLNLKRFILDVGKNLGSTDINPDIIDSLIFSKKILLDGDKEFITSNEARDLLTKLSQILLLGFDSAYAKNEDFQSKEEHAQFNLMNVRKLYTVLLFGQPDFKLFTVDQVLLLVKNLNKDKYQNVQKFKPSILSLKRRLLGRNGDGFYLSDAKKILDIIHDYDERDYFNIVTYDELRETLEKNEVILHLDQLDLPVKYAPFSRERVAELHHDFEETAVDIRYFRSKNSGVPYLGREIRRNHYGFHQSAFITWLAKKLIDNYGHKNSQGHPQLSAVEFKLFLDEAEPILRELKLWSPNPAYAQNAILFADLFQSNSNGDQEVNSAEATEYGQMVVSSVAAADKFNKGLALVCDTGINRDDPLYTTECFDENYFETFMNEVGYKNSFPALDNYVRTASRFEIGEYLKGVKDFARENPDKLAPINKRDSTLIIGAMLNIESTFIRFDTNGDNIVDYDELCQAFGVYKKTIIALAKLDPEKEVFAKSIFLYMVSKSKAPPAGSIMKSVRFYAFHKCVSSEICRKVFLKKIEAKRLNIGKLMSYLAKPKDTGIPKDDEDDDEDDEVSGF